MSEQAGAARMLELVAGLPDDLAASERLPGLADVRPLAAPPRRLLLCGLGGSAIAGDLAAPLAARRGLSLDVWRDYDLPAWHDPSMLTVLSSYSGNTEETLSAARAALAAGGPLLFVASGGELRELARRAGTSTRPCPLVALPPGLPPRAALGHSLGALLWAWHALGLLPSPRAEIAAAVATLHASRARYLGAADSPGNDAARIARALLGRLAVIYTTSVEAHAAGVRLKCQINENAKSPAYAAALPELDHNDIVGWEVLRRRRDDFSLLLLRGGDEHPRNARRAQITRELVAGEFHAVHEVRARGESALARILSLVQFGDFLSCYLAEAAGVDPLPVSRIDALKNRLNQGE